MKRVVVVAPHPDDETLGCGGTLLRHRAEGDETHWLIVTSMKATDGWPTDRIETRKRELDQVAAHYNFSSRIELDIATSHVDKMPRAELVRAFSRVFDKLMPEILYLPYVGDAHSDHRHVAESAGAASKWFRCRSLRQVFAYETLSETGFNPFAPAFHPNSYVDIGPHIEGKLMAMRLYLGEMDSFPFPRSDEAIRAQATLRGSACGKIAAEAFISLTEIR